MNLTAGSLQRFHQDNWSSTASPGKANDWRSRERVVLDLFSNLKWERSKGFCGVPLKHVMTLREHFLVSRTDDDLSPAPLCVHSKRPRVHQHHATHNITRRQRETDTEGNTKKPESEMIREPQHSSTPMSRLQSGSGLLSHTGGTCSHSSVIDYPRFPVSELHLGNSRTHWNSNAGKSTSSLKYVQNQQILISTCNGSKKLK